MSARLFLAALLVSARDAAAAEFLVLPATEDAADWDAAAGVAGLSVAAGPRAAVGDDAVIRLEAHGGSWILRATNAGGVVRTARVAPPATEADREEIAHLAAALARDLGRTSVAAPAPRPLPVPPPPPPPVAARATAPPPPPLKVAAPPESGADAAPALPDAALAQLPAPAAVPESPVGDVVDPWVDLALIGAFPPRPATVPEPPSETRRRRDRRLRSPPLLASTGSGLRGGVQPSMIQTIGWEPYAWSSGTALSLTLGYSAPRSIGDLNRTVFAWHLDVAPLAGVGRVLRIGPVGGVSYRLYRQQNTPIQDVFTPYVGVRSDAAVLGVGGWRFGPGVQGTIDFGRTMLVAEDGSRRLLSPVQLDLAFQVRFVPRRNRSGDPISGSGTSRDRDPPPGGEPR